MNTVLICNIHGGFSQGYNSLLRLASFQPLHYAAEHSVHPTGGYVLRFQAGFWLKVGPIKVALTRPTYPRVTQSVRPLDAMVTAIRIQWLPKSRNPASIGNDSRENGTAETKFIASAVQTIANAAADTFAYLGFTNIDIPIVAPKVWAVLKEKSVAL